MDEIKSTYRDVKDGAKKAVRGVDGTNLKDSVGNAGDKVRTDLGNLGDDTRAAAQDADTRADDPGAARAKPA
jgi:hypothetical protein